MHSDRTFNGKLMKHLNSKKHGTPRMDRVSQHISNKFLMNSLMILSKLRIHILSDRRVCFAGRMPRGVYMPRNSWVQFEIIKRMIIWYLPCLELQGNVYSLNNTCYTEKENKFLIILLTNLIKTLSKPF